jgi:hypothetical protein
MHGRHPCRHDVFASAVSVLKQLQIRVSGRVSYGFIKTLMLVSSMYDRRQSRTKNMSSCDLTCRQLSLKLHSFQKSPKRAEFCTRKQDIPSIVNGVCIINILVTSRSMNATEQRLRCIGWWEKRKLRTRSVVNQIFTAGWCVICLYMDFWEFFWSF